MSFEFRNNQFTDEEEARAEIEAAGFFPVTVEIPADKVGDHWHDFDSMVYVLEGEISVSVVDTGEQCVCKPGDVLVAKAGIVHTEEHTGYKAVIGLSVDPTQLTQPIIKMGRPES